MQVDFHYYAVYVLAKAVGFSPKESSVIAYASQYVDDATESTPINLSGQVFDPICTSHTGLDSLGWNVQREIYMPFHYLPNRVRREGPEEFTYTVRPSTTLPSGLNTLLFDSVLKEAGGDMNFFLVRLGVALHTIADTFAHQGFSGKYGSVNHVAGLKAWKNGKLESDWIDSAYCFLYPKIGHQKALLYPDYSYLTWQYKNGHGDCVQRSNRDIFLCASKFILGLLSKVTGSAIAKEDLLFSRILQLFGNETNLENRCSAWQSAFDTPVYSSLSWRNAALDGNTAWNTFSRHKKAKALAKIKMKTDFDSSYWALFHRAAFLQRALVLEAIN